MQFPGITALPFLPTTRYDWTQSNLEIKHKTASLSSPSPNLLVLDPKVANHTFSRAVIATVPFPALIASLPSRRRCETSCRACTHHNTNVVYNAKYPEFY